MCKLPLFYIFVLVFTVTHINCDGYFSKSDDDDEQDRKNSIKDHNQKVSENQLAAQILAIVEHFQQDDPIGLPGVPIPDPMTTQDTKTTMMGTTMELKDIKVFGVSKFRLKKSHVDLQKMRVETLMQLDHIHSTGNYKMKALFQSSSGPFTVDLHDVYAQGNATLGVMLNGQIQVQDIIMDMWFEDMKADFQNLGVIGAVFQSALNSQPKLIFDSIKPTLLKEAYGQMIDEIDTNIDKMVGDRKFSNSISPLDMVIAELRKEIRTRGFDPFRVPDYNQTAGIFAVKMKNTWVVGISSFYRVGNVTTVLDKNIATMGLQMGTQKIVGSTHWEIKMGMLTRAGTAQFSIQHFKMNIQVSQSLDTRKRPHLKELQLELGNIQVRCEGAGTLDYVAELAVNILPNVLRYQIMDAIENPIKMRIQEELNKFDVESFIKNNVTQFIVEGPENYKFNFKFDF